MKCISLLLVLFFEQIQGSTEMIQMFLPTGERSSICFSADNLPKNFVFYKSNITIGTCYYHGNPNLRKNFTGKVELSCPASLIFPNPQTSDCGVYCAWEIGNDTKIRTCFNFTFQDPVSPVELKVDPISNSSCNHKVTCRTEDNEINGTLMCDDKSCHLVAGERSKVTKSGDSLRLYLSNESITCYHSNQVNWTQNKKKIQPCSEGSTVQTIIIIVVAVLLSVAIAGGVYCLKKKKKLCFAQRQPESSNSQMLSQPHQVNGNPHVIPESDHLMDENIEDSPV